MLAVVLWGMLAFLIDNLNSFTIIKPNSSFFFWTWLALLSSFLFGAKGIPTVNPKAHRWLMAFLVLVCLACFGLAGRCAGYMFWLSRGAQSVNAGDLKSGRMQLGRAQAFDPLDVRVWTVLGMSYLREFQTTQKADDLEKARHAFEQASMTAPNFYHSFLILSRIEAYKGNSAKAAELQQKAMAISPYETQRDLHLLAGGQR